MRRYVYKRPLLKVSTTPIPIKDEYDHSIGCMQRTYRGKLSTACSWVLNSWEVSINGEDNRTGEAVRLADNRIWFNRNSWTVTITRQGEMKTGILRDQSKAITNPKFSYAIDDQEYLISKEPLSRITQIVHVNKDVLVCEIEHAAISTRTKRTLTLQREDLSPILLASMDHLIISMY